ncbi:MAG: trehalose-6-phosphate synthase, partial [Candidatus Omnitrophota bacterium]
IMQELKGLWVCCGSGEADKLVAKKSKVKVPPQDPAYELRYVWLSKDENLGYYYGYANQGLWPLSHLVYVKPIFRESDWSTYKEVNKKFAQNIYEEIKGKKAIVFVQDYHLGLVSKYLKELKPDALTLLFWHIPWPTYDVFRVLPQKQELLEGLLSYNLLGFHIRHFCNNFLSAVANEMEAKVNRENSSVVYKGQTCLVRPYPISVDFEGIDKIARSEDVEQSMVSLKEEFGLSGYKVVVGLDRIDYTKGISERILAVDTLLDKHPELKEKIVFIQMGEISRIHLPQYKQLNDQINALVEEVNFKHAQHTWKPIIFVRKHLKFSDLLAFYRLADVCVVSSLHDGMNLVAKEFICSRIDCKGALVLSKFTGASRELSDAILVNPYSHRETAEGLYQALSAKDDQIRQKMKKLRQTVQRNNIWKWTGKIIADTPK